MRTQGADAPGLTAGASPEEETSDKTHDRFGFSPVGFMLKTTFKPLRNVNSTLGTSGRSPQQLLVLLRYDQDRTT